MGPMDLTRRVAAFLVLIVIVLFGPTLFAQVVEATGAEVATPAQPTAGWALVWAFFSASGLEWLKRNRTLTLITERTAFGVQRALGIVLAVAATLGIQWSFDASAGVLTVTGLQVATMWAFGAEVLKTWVTQEVMYRVAIKNYRPGEN